MTAIVDDFVAIRNAIGNALAPEQPARMSLAMLWHQLDEITDLLVDGYPSGGELSEEEDERLSAQAIELQNQIVTSRAVSVGDVWGKFKLLESVMVDDAEPDHNALRADISSALQNLAVAPEPQTALAGDEEILALFKEWRSAAMAWKKAPDGEDERRCYRELREIQTALQTTPSVGVVGLAIKTYLILAVEEGSDCAGTLTNPARTSDEVEGCAATIRDLIRFAPVLEPLCADCLEKMDAGIAEAKLVKVQS